MHINEPLIALALAIVAALAAGMLLKRLRQPALVGYLLTGIILGPSVLAVVESRDNITFLADLGILLLLFVVGMELSLRGFRGIWKIAIATAALQIAAACAIMWMMSFAFGWSTGTAIVFGFVVSLSSTAVVIKLLEDLNLLRTQVGQLTIGVLIAQDLAIIPMLLILGMITGGADISYGESGAKIALSLLLLAGLVIFLSRREKISLPFSSALVASVELRPLYGTAICFGAAGIAGLLGLSTVYGAFLAGLIVGNSRSRRVIFQSVQPLQNLLVMAFFLSIGLLIDLQFVYQHIWQVLVILLFVTVGKTAINIGILILLREPWPHAFISGLLLAQIGEFSFLLGAIANQSGLITADEFQLVITVTAFTLIISPLWLASARRLLRIAVAGASNIDDVMQKIRIGGIAAMWRAAKDRPLPQALAFRIFGRPHARNRDAAAKAAKSPPESTQ